MIILIICIRGGVRDDWGGRGRIILQRVQHALLDLQILVLRRAGVLFHLLEHVIAFDSEKFVVKRHTFLQFAPCLFV